MLHAAEAAGAMYERHLGQTASRTATDSSRQERHDLELDRVACNEATVPLVKSRLLQHRRSPSRNGCTIHMRACTKQMSLRTKQFAHQLRLLPAALQLLPCIVILLPQHLLRSNCLLLGVFLSCCQGRLEARHLLHMSRADCVRGYTSTPQLHPCRAEAATSPLQWT